jgi:inner membrane protein
MENLEKVKNSLFNSVGLKLALIAFLSLVLMIPALMIMNLIREREQRSNETINEVTALWGNEQTLTAPVLTLQVVTLPKPGQNTSGSTTRYVHFLPENLKITGNAEPEVRHRGIYRVVTYRSKLHVTGNFLPPDLEALKISKEEISGIDAWIEIGIPDMRGINQNIRIHWGDSVSPVIPGTISREIVPSGVHAPVKIDYTTPVIFSFDVDLNGSSGLNFIPLGKETNVDLTSTWTAPRFKGAFLPDNQKVDEKGFTAHWNILQLNRNYPQQWIDNQYKVDESSFGVDLITQVDTYQKSMRSAKYAILFIVLTFLVFFFAEIMTSVRIHIFNYLLVGIALCIFYSLLTALAEYIPFTIAYLIASTVIIGMIAIYAHSLYSKKQVTLTVTMTLAALYIYLFVILQLANYSLIIGNIGLVFILGLVMYFSRKIDWYSPVKSHPTVE